MSPRPGRFALAFCLALTLPLPGLGQPPKATAKPAQGKDQPLRTDLHNDPLPPGAVARLGTRSMSHRDAVHFVQFTPSGKGVISGSHNEWLGYWDVALGERRRDFEAA